MTQQPAKTGFHITEPGNEVLSLLRGDWGTMTKIVEKSRVNEKGVPGIYPTVVEIDTPIKRLNKHLSKESFHELGEYIKPEHLPRFTELINQGEFEVEKAIQVLKYAPLALLAEFQPEDWKEASDLPSPTFSTFSKYRGPETAKRLMVAMLAELSDDFGRRSDLNPKRSLAIANRLLNKIKNLTLSEFKLALNMIRNNPSRISNLDSQTVINFVKAFKDKKLELAQKQSEEERHAYSGSVLDIAERYEKRKNRELRFDEVMKFYK